MPPACSTRVNAKTLRQAQNSPTKVDTLEVGVERGE
jgi:hypothetical protein